MMRHQNYPNFEDKCFCATVAACARKVYNDTMPVSKQIQFSNAKHACRSGMTNKSGGMEKRYFCTGGREVEGAVFLPSEVNI